MRNAWFAFLLVLTLAACNLGGSPPVSERGSARG
jgi:hypothetical protein